MLFTWLLSSLSDSILPRVVGCKHAWQVWEKIQNHFYTTMKAKVRQLRFELKITKKGSRSINEYLLRIKAIVDQLIAAGDTLSDQEHIDVVLDGLPEEYNSFVMMIYARSDSPSISDIESLLLLQEAQFDKFKQELSAGTVSANIAQGPHNQQNQNSFSGNRGRGGRNFNNRGRGGRNYNGRGRGGPKPTCQICFKYGHDAFQCWSRFDENFIQPPPPDQNNDAPNAVNSGDSWITAINSQNSHAPNAFIAAQQNQGMTQGMTQVPHITSPLMLVIWFKALLIMV